MKNLAFFALSLSASCLASSSAFAGSTSVNRIVCKASKSAGGEGRTLFTSSFKDGKIPVAYKYDMGDDGCGRCEFGNEDLTLDGFTLKQEVERDREFVLSLKNGIVSLQLREGGSYSQSKTVKAQKSMSIKNDGFPFDETLDVGDSVIKIECEFQSGGVG